MKYNLDQIAVSAVHSDYNVEPSNSLGLCFDSAYRSKWYLSGWVDGWWLAVLEIGIIMQSPAKLGLSFNWSYAWAELGNK